MATSESSAPKLRAPSQSQAPGRPRAIARRGHDTRRFGTFLGVYLPSILTILGVMMFLRFGWVVGNAGLLHALFILTLASSITLITSLSASAIATNMRVGVGGEYYMVSRSLGPEFGGAIGIPLFLCRTLSLTLYCFGLAETLGVFWPPEWGEFPLQAVAATFVLAITVLAGRSAELTLKLQIPILIAVGASVLALAIGVLGGPFRPIEWGPSYERGAPEGFWYVFAVFFPAVTGFTAGIGLSGDLRDPRRSIPTGTLLAVITGYITYAVVLVLLSISGATSGEHLAIHNPDAPPVWTEIAFLGFWLIYPGMWGAILSSAFGSALSGPRVLQALANDGLAPSFLSRLSPSGQPTIATWVTGGIAILAITLGDLNAVGVWVTVFFLTLYVMINLSAAVESVVGNPSYRPTISAPWWLSLTGCAGAILVMFLINPMACLVAALLELGILIYLQRRLDRNRWGDVQAGFWLSLARFALLQLRKRPQDSRNWRPQILVFVANPARREGLVRLANGFNQNRGVLTVSSVIEGDVQTGEIDIPARRAELQQALTARELTAFATVNVVENFEQGVLGIAQANGFAGLQANSLMFGWPGDTGRLERLLRIVRTVNRLHMSTLLCRLANQHELHGGHQIDIYWRGRQNNGDLMLLLAHLLRLNPEWSGASINVRRIIESKARGPILHDKLAELFGEARLPARPDIIVREPDQPIEDIMRQASRDADLVFLGLEPPASPDKDAPTAERLASLSTSFQNVVFVHNASPFRGAMLEV